jgi:hypothetical protein
MYDFRNINISRQFKILIDGQPYDPKKNYTQVHDLEISSETTEIQLHGLIRLTYINLNDCIKLEPFSVKFSSEFIGINDRQFHETLLVIVFRNVSQFSKLAEFIRNYKDKHDYNRVDDTLTIYLDRIQNFRLADYIDITLDYLGDFSKGGGFSIADEDIFVTKKQGDFEIRSERDQGEHVILSESALFKREQLGDKNYIDFVGGKAPPFKRVINIYQYKHTKTSKMNNVMKGMRPCFTASGQFVTLSSYNFKENKSFLKINKIEPNKHLGQGKEFYMGCTKVAYLECLQERINYYNSEQRYAPNQLFNINDYTLIIQTYMNNLESSKGMTDNTKVKESLENEIQVLKLFKLLFLNNVQGKNYTNSLRVEVKLLRKARLVEWLVKNSEGFYQSKLNNTNDVLLSLISGRHDVVMRICTERSDYPKNILSGLASITRNKANLRENIETWKISGLYDAFSREVRKVYEIMSSPDIDVYSNEILSLMNWKTLLVSLMMNTLPYRSYIPEAIQQYETILGRFSLPAPRRDSRNFDLCYLLIKYLAVIETNSPSQDIANLLEDTNFLTDGFVSHHIQYIIVSILLNTIHEAYYYNAQEEKIALDLDNVLEHLQKVHFRLLIKSIEEFLLYDDWKHALQLVSNSSISQRVKNNICKDILMKFAHVAEGDSMFLEIKDKTVHEAYAQYMQYKFDSEKAYLHYYKADNYIMAFETFLYYVVYPAIISENTGRDIHDQLKYFSQYGEKILKWKSHGAVILDYLFYIERINSVIDELDFERIEAMIRKVEQLTGELGGKNIHRVRNIILKNLRMIYNWLAATKSSNDVDFIFYFLGSLLCCS